jgi:hypothetical protein
MTDNDTAKRRRDRPEHEFPGEDYDPDRAARQGGWAPYTMWDCEDGWVVGHSTAPLKGDEEFEGAWLAVAYERRGEKFVLVESWPFEARKDVETRADILYYQHSPAAAERDGFKPERRARSTRSPAPPP